ncbi:MAG: cytochrome b/b6 domain-containing protein [Caulobacteraceae bacterium]
MGVQPTRIRLWDGPVRLIHWSIAGLLVVSWWTQDHDLMSWHRRSGYAIAALLAFRLFWGVFGSQTARFSSFIKGPRAVLAYVRGRAVAGLGHTPLGAFSVIALLAALIAQVGMGLFAIDEEGFESGPLARFVSFDTARAVAGAHEWGFRIILALSVLHIAAIAWYALKGKNLIGPMITGRKRLALDMPEPARAKAWAYVAGVVLAAAVFALLLWLNAQAHLG